MAPKAQEEATPLPLPVTPETPAKKGWQNAKALAFESSGGVLRHKSSRRKNVRRRDTVIDLMESTSQHSFSLLRVTWYFIMATSVFFDFMSVLLPAIFLSEGQEQDGDNNAVGDTNQNKGGSIFSAMQSIYVDELSDKQEEAWYMGIIEWLRDNGTTIYMFFAVLWFVNSFVSAYQHRQVVLKDLDRQRVLAMKIANSPLRASVVTRKEDDDDLDEDWTAGAWTDYWNALIFQLVLLPVGFYILAGHKIEAFIRSDVDFDSDKEIVFYLPENNGVPEYEHKLSTHTHQSLLFALLHYAGMVLQRVVGLEKDVFINVVKTRIKIFGKKFAFGAIRHPKQVWQRVRKILKIVRWAKYLTPLIGACNKLLGNTKDLLKIRRQAKEAAIALRCRQALWSKLEGDELKEQAAIIIQGKWRAYRTQKSARALKILTGNKEALMAIKMQKVIKGMLDRARVRLIEKESELKRLRREHELAIANHGKYRVSIKERQRMYKLEAELGRTCKDMLNKRLLMRPNTRFAFIWKFLFVTCVILEIAQLAAAPMLQQYKDETTNEPLHPHQVIEQKLVPSPIEEWEVCLPKFKPEAPKKGFAKILENWRSSKNKEEEQEIPWYCNSPYPEAYAVYAKGLKFMITEFLVFVGFVCFLDVFVTFFTGELDREGFLNPKPFFARWILPGLVLQLLVNPQMVNVSQWVATTMKNTASVGPVRVARWSIALFVPAAKTIFNAVQLHIWLPFVKKENESETAKAKPASLLQ